MSRKKQILRQTSSQHNSVVNHRETKIDDSIHIGCQTQTQMSQLLSSSTLWFPAVAMFVAVVAALSNYPESIKMIEAFDFYIATPDFILSKLAEYPGGNSLFVAWLLQFFQSSAIGISIEALLLTIVALLSAGMAVAWGKKANGICSIIPTAGLLLLFTHRISLSIEGIFLYGSIMFVGLCARSSKTWLLAFVLILVGMLSFWMVSFPISVLLMLSISILALIKNKAKRDVGFWIQTLLPLLFIFVTIIAVKISSSALGFIPFDNRWWYTNGVGDDELYYVLLLSSPIALMFIPRIRIPILNIGVNVLLSVMVAVVCYYQVKDNEEYKISEDVYYISALAEKGEWHELLSEVKSHGEINNTVYLQFALLAEAHLGTLNDNLFSYPINTPENFCPRFDSQPLGSDFCRIFYRELGLYDEAFHHAFEYGMKTSQSNGFCFASLRHMTEYSVKVGDKALAEKYMYLLEQSSCHTDFVSTQRQMLATTIPTDTVVRAKNFIRTFPFNTEMAYLLDFDPDNRLVLDYLLCGLLLTKQLETFKTVLCHFSEVYKNKELPRAYAEAACMINHIRPGVLGEHIVYSSKYDKQFEQFLALHNSQQDDSEFINTFWYYYTYAQIPALQEWQNTTATS